MGLNEIQSYPAIETGTIQSVTSSSSGTTFKASYLSLIDTPTSFPSSQKIVTANSAGIGHTQLNAALTDFNDTPTNESGADVQTFLENLDTKVQSNQNNLTPNADPTNTTTVDNAGAVMDGDFGSNGLMRRTGSGTYDTISTGLDNLTSSEVSQLQNIDSVAISNSQWDIVGQLDQDVSTTADATFNTVNNLTLSELTTGYQITAGSSNTRTLTVDKDESVSNLLVNVSDDPAPVLGGNLNTNGNNTIRDGNSNELIIYNQVASAVNHLELGNNSTTNNPTISAIGDDTNIGLDISTKGTGDLRWNGTTLTQNQWNNYITTTDQALDTGSSVGFTNLGLSNGYWQDSNNISNQINSVSLSNNSKAPLSSLDSTKTMWVVILDQTGSVGMGTFFCDSSSNSTVTIGNNGNWSDTLGTTSSNNVDWDGSAFVIENKSGSGVDYMVSIFSS